MKQPALLLCAVALATSRPAGAAEFFHWTSMPLLSPAQKAAGISPGGEGGQWPRTLLISRADPKFLLLGIDVGGLYRSLDGGNTWRQASIGWDARGANAFAIDPRNADRVLGVAGNSLDWNPGWGPSPHGVYMSEDRAASWTQVLPQLPGQGGSVAFDEASYDTRTRTCRVAYFASSTAGLFRTEDGGRTWSHVSDQPVGMAPDPNTPVGIRTHPSRAGVLYLGGRTGLFRSEDAGKTFTRARDGEVWGMDTAPTAPDDVYLSGSFGLLVSHDAGRTFSTLPAAGLDRDGGKPVRDIAVNPADPQRMSAWVQGDNWRWVRYTSHDSGRFFQPWTFDNRLAVLPFNVRQGYAAWHPTDANTVFGLGGDWVTKSADGGKTFRWNSNGFNGVMLGGSFAFSVHEPSTVFLGFQDYNGAFTIDGGRAWNYRDVSGLGWGGHVYGAYAVNRSVMWGGNAPDWGGKRSLRISRDGGKTWSNATGPDGMPAVWSGPDVSFSDPSNAGVLFASNWRSTDKGASWNAMNDCDGVFTSSPRTKALYGKKGDTVVRSTDHGATWTTVVDVPGGFADLAVDHETGRIYAASEDRLKVWEKGAWTTIDTPKDQRGATRVTTVAVDPKAPSIVYAGGPRNIYKTSATVFRSTDRGRTWTNLTPSAPGQDGPWEVSWVRVHPVTRWAWVNGQCFGMWKIAPPSLARAR